MPSGGRTRRLDVSNARLGYDRGRVTPGIVHLGAGAFHRAHMAVYVDELLAQDSTWGIVGASLRKPDVRDALAGQDFIYCVIVRGGSATTIRHVGSLLDVIDANTQRDRLISVMCDPRIRIVSLTVTEKGYCHDPATGRLRNDHPDILFDLVHPDAPVSAPGLIVRALELRREAGVRPFSVLSCDNLPANGTLTRGVIVELAALRDRNLADFIAGEVSFPSTMVDRIVPSTTQEDRAFVSRTYGFDDSWPVVTEPFTQWVVEDDFPAGRPAFERVGVELVPDVRAFEFMKLRMLNGSHSSLAYLANPAGFEVVSEAMREPALARFVHDFMTDEVIATLPDGLGDLPAYRDALLDRFSNPALKHQTAQIAMDGSQKLPQRLLGTIRDRLGTGGAIDLTALGVAAWMRYVTGRDERGQRIEVDDPMAGRLRAIAMSAGNDPGRLVEGYLGVGEVFGEDLPDNDLFRDTLIRHLSSLLQFGTVETVKRLPGWCPVRPRCLLRQPG